MAQPTLFKTARGEVSRYGFACGYMQRHETDNLRLDLWHEGAVFHVRAHNFERGQRIFWESFENLTEARLFWREKKRELFGKARQ